MLQASSKEVPRFGGTTLVGIRKCPHCSVAHPTLTNVWVSEGLVPRALAGPGSKWGTYVCTTCGGAILAKSHPGDKVISAPVDRIIPDERTAHADLPEPARTYLQQAYETLRAPDAAAVMAGSAVDSMLKEIGYKDGSVYARIKKAVADHKLTEGMGKWADEVRLGSNRPRHADDTRPHVSAEEAEQAVEFAEALGFFLFVLTKRIERGLKAAEKASAAP